MSRPLGYLRRRLLLNGVRRFFARLRTPGRAIPLAIAAAVVVLFLVSAANRPAETATGASVVLLPILSMLYALSLIGGLSERGVAFDASEVDFLFPGPFTPRRLVVHHVIGQYAATLLPTVVLTLFLARGAPSSVAAAVAILLLLVTCAHVRLCLAALVTRLSDGVWAKVRGPLRAVLIVVSIAVGIAAMLAFSGLGGVRGAVDAAVRSPAARWILFPAIVAGDLARAASWQDAATPLLRALAVAVGTLAALLLAQGTDLEASIGASVRRAELKARLRRGRTPGLATAAGRATSTSRSARSPRARPLRGAGALAWSNLLTARRSTRALLGSLVFVGLVLVPVLLANRAGGKAAPPPIVFALLVPLFMSTHLPYDFRGATDRMGLLKTLPVSPLALAAAMVAVPTGLLVATQAAVLGAVAGFGRATAAEAVLGTVACAPVAAFLVARSNYGHLVAPKAAAIRLTIEVLLMVADGIVLAGLGALLHAFDVPLLGIAAVLFVVECVLVFLLLRLVGDAFRAYDVAEEAGG